MTEEALLNEMNASLTRTLKNRGLEPTDYNRKEILQQAVDHWLDSPITSTYLQLMMTLAQRELLRLRVRLPEAHQ